MRTAVIGAGSWGTALALVLSDNGHEVALWDRNRERLLDMKERHVNERYLPGVALPDGIAYEPDAEKALAGAELAVFAVPAQHFARVFGDLSHYLGRDALAVNVAKGIDCGTLERLSEAASRIRPEGRYAVLSGPSHAEEVGRRLPAALVSSSVSDEDAEAVQTAFMNSVFRVYTNTDLAGVELGGALKNIIALAAGISDGLGCGDNAKAALMTRGLTEMIRLGMRMGADPNTFSGLSGMGDLIVTCGSVHSRNRRCGMLIGQGVSPDDAVKQVGMVVEGMYTAKAAAALSGKLGVEMPITEALCGVIDGKASAEDALGMLMGRKKKHENEDILRTL